jgi:hypothetical protein
LPRRSKPILITDLHRFPSLNLIIPKVTITESNYTKSNTLTQGGEGAHSPVG